MSQAEFVSLYIAVLTVSDTRTEANDQSGGLLTQLISESGHRLYEKVIVPDHVSRIREYIGRWCADDRVTVVITTGGTGVTGRDSTPEAVRPLLDKELEGFGELFRFISFQEIGSSSMQSRSFAGVANGTYIFCLPGSTNACATAWRRLIEPQLDRRTKPCNLVELMPRLNEN
jgi:molybdenum cofactor biosynthesis protein B